MEKMKLNYPPVFKMVILIALCLSGLVCLNAQEFAGGQGTEADPRQIETAEHLNNVRNYLGEEHSDKYFIQTANIDLYDATREGGEYWNNGEGWIPIGDSDNRFWGDYNGDGLEIEGIYINRPETNYQGLFGYTNSAVIQNLGVYNVGITGRGRVGILMGYAEESTISNCYSTGNVTGDKRSVGGLVGYADHTSINRSYSTGNVTSDKTHVGGLAGSVWGSTIRNCSSNGNVTGKGYYVGGLAGNAIRAKITGSYSRGSVTVDFLRDVYIEPPCFSAGGLVGRVSDSIITNCYSTASVSGEWRIGGLVGCAEGSTNIYNSYSKGLLAGRSNVGGLVGETRDNSVVRFSYWDMNTSGRDVSAGGEGRTTGEMTYPYDDDTYLRWNFDIIWKTDLFGNLNNGYPLLREPPVSIEDGIVLEVPFSPILTNYPNPFNPGTTIEFNIKGETDATLSIYNIKGQLVNTLHNGTIKTGEHRIIWDGKDNNGRDAGSGVYFYRLKTDEYDKINKMMLVK